MNNEKDNLLNDLQIIKTTLEKLLIDFKDLFNFDSFVKLYESEIKLEEYNGIFDRIETLDVSLLESKLGKLKEIIIKYIDDIKYNWEAYNQNFKTYLTQKIRQLSNDINNIEIKNTNKVDLNNYISNILECLNKIMNIEISNNDLVEIFSTTNRNYVIFGKNGAGKTRLLNYVKNNYFKTNAYVVPSNRNIEFGKLSNIHIDYREKTNLTNVFVYETFKGYPSDYLNVMLRDMDHEELRKGESIVSENGEHRGKTLNKFVNIFNSLSLERKVKMSPSNNSKIMLYGDNIPDYYVSDASDGEKSIIQFILFILFCPIHSFVFIDEPETHLNNALLCELFTILEQERNDIIFIYCTHNIDFIETRENIKLIFLNKYNKDSWDIESLESYDKIPLNVIIDIIGTKKDILFIEGDYSSIDYKIYSALFPKLKIIPVSSCQKVIENCRSINLFNRKYYGIVDNDFRTVDEIEKLKQQNIEVIKFNEIENMILSIDFLEFVSSKLGCNDKLDILKQDIINKARTGKTGIIQDYINKVFPKYQKSEHINYVDIDTLRVEINNINNENRDNFIESLSKFIEEFDKLIINEDYNSIIKRLPNKGFISSVTNLGLTKERYLKFLFLSLNENIEFRNKIISNNFILLRENI